MPNSSPLPPVTTLMLLGELVQDDIERRAAVVRAELARGRTAHALLARTLPFLRSLDAKGLRNEVLAALEDNERSPKVPHV